MSPCMRKFGSSGDACNSIRHAYRYSRICIRHAPWCAHLAPSWPQPATAGPRHPPASIPCSQADQTGARAGGTAGTAGLEPDVVEVEPSSKAKSVKWSEGRLMLLYAGLMHATRALRVRTLAGRVIVLARLAHCCECRRGTVWGPDAWDDASLTSGHATLPRPLSPPPLPPSPSTGHEQRVRLRCIPPGTSP